MNKENILTWAEAKLLDEFSNDDLKNQASEETAQIYLPISMVEIKRGSFVSVRGFTSLSSSGFYNSNWHHYSKPQEVEIAYDFLVMPKPLTQWNWFHTVGLNEKGFLGWARHDYNQKHFKGFDSSIGFFPDAPMRFTSFWSVLFYANMVSLDKGLKPVYDLDYSDFEGSIEEGNLRPAGGEITDKIRNALNIDVSKAFGFRLMTEAEYDFLATRRGSRDPETRVFADVSQQGALDYKYKDFLSHDINHNIDADSIKPVPVGDHDIYGLHASRDGEFVFGGLGISSSEVNNQAVPQYSDSKKPFIPIIDQNIVKGSTSNQGSNNGWVGSVSVEQPTNYSIFRLVRTLPEKDR